MYRIVLVEDEPAAVENIQDIIRLYCPRFEIAACGNDGAEGLELAHRHNPDLLFTDIRMPRMSGLELITRLHEEMPGLKTIIISGYQDFEYARSALQHGAVDYLLKPLSPAALRAALDRVIPLINADLSEKRINLILKLLDGETPDARDLEKYFGAPCYTAAIFRKNGLPSRFSGRLHAYFPRYIPNSESDNGSIDLFGRDEMECIHIAPGNSQAAENKIETLNWPNRDIPGYSTLAVCHDPFPVTEIKRTIDTLYAALDSSLTIGKNKVISAGTHNRKYAEKINALENETDQYLNYYLKENKTSLIKNFLLDCLKKWEAEEKSQLYVEEKIRLFLDQIRKASGCPSGDENFEHMIEDAFFYAMDYDDLKESVLYIMEKTLPDQHDAISKVDTPEFFELIREYLNSHLAENLTLQFVCKHFGISQAYLSRLFRKYTGLSFISHLTFIRMEKAKQHLASGGGLIRDAAAMVGFNDQFYFSRVFRSYTGKSPSEYIRKNEEP